MPRQFSDTVMQSYYTARTDNGEWYTPSSIVEPCRAILGNIDLDPFSCAMAQETVKARHFLTAEDDAIVCPWPIGETLFANPPYGRSIRHCINRVVTEHGRSWQRGIVLVNNCTDTEWFTQLAQIATVMCFFKRRIQFIHPEGTLIDRNTRGQVAVGVEVDNKVFTHHLHRLGLIAYL